MNKDKPLAQGWLQKRSPKKRRFFQYVERFFQLFTTGDVGYIVYKKKEKEITEIGRIVLTAKSNLTLLGRMDDGRWKFIIFAPKNTGKIREWHLYTKSETEYNEWIKSIRYCGVKEKELGEHASILSMDSQSSSNSHATSNEKREREKEINDILQFLELEKEIPCRVELLAFLEIEKVIYECKDSNTLDGTKVKQIWKKFFEQGAKFSIRDFLRDNETFIPMNLNLNRNNFPRSFFEPAIQDLISFFRALDACSLSHAMFFIEYFFYVMDIKKTNPLEEEFWKITTLNMSAGETSGGWKVHRSNAESVKHDKVETNGILSLAIKARRISVYKVDMEPETKIYSALTEMKTRKAWEKGLEEVNIKEEDEIRNKRIVYFKFRKIMKLNSWRNYDTILFFIERKLNDGTILVASSSVIHSDCKPIQNLFRCFIPLDVWMIKPQNEKGNSCTVSQLSMSYLNKATTDKRIYLRQKVPAFCRYIVEQKKRGTLMGSKPKNFSVTQSPVVPNDADDFIVNVYKGDKIGQGQFGEIYLGNWADTKIALKKLKDSDLSMSSNQSEEFLLSKMRHPNVVTYYGIALIDGDEYLMMEYFPLGSVQSLLEQHKLSTFHLIEIAIDVCKGMSFVANKKIVHRDIALRNLLVARGTEDRKFVVKIADFGLAREFKDFHQALSSSLPWRWCSIESLKTGMFNTESDVWSFGVTLWELFEFGKKKPFSEVGARHELVSLLESGKRLPKPSECPDKVYAVMHDCWKANPGSRPTFPQLQKALTDLSNEFLEGKTQELESIVHEYEKFRLSQLVPVHEYEKISNQTEYQNLQTAKQ